MLSSCKTLGISTEAVSVSRKNMLRRRRSPPPVFALAFVLLAALTECRAANPPGAAPALAKTQALPAMATLPFPYDSAKRGSHILALAEDTGHRIWCSSEDNGLWRLEPGAQADRQWRHYGAADGLADDSILCLATDSIGRLWAGTNRHGVSVLVGDHFVNYDQAAGPLGAHVAALAERGTDLWMGTESGLTRYREPGIWTYYTRANGLPADDITALTFDASGLLIAGTGSAGMAIAGPIDDYSTWHPVVAPAGEPDTHGGEGLPSDLVNCLITTGGNTVYCGTNLGLARSDSLPKDDESVSVLALPIPQNRGGWRFLRGSEWLAKARSKGMPANIHFVDTHGHSLLEDHVTCLAEEMPAGGASAHLWIGYWRQGYEVVDEVAGARLFSSAQRPGAPGFLRAILPLSDGSVLLGYYGGGAVRVKLSSPMLALPASSGQAAGPRTDTPAPAAQRQTPSPIPPPAPPPGFSELDGLLRDLESLPKPGPGATVLALDDDWRSRGSWLGRYGRYWACLCAYCSPQDYLWGAGAGPVAYHLQIGANHPAKDSLRYWVEWLYTLDPRCLEMPSPYWQSRVQRKLAPPGQNRREAEVDDHGEVLPVTQAGPNVYCTLDVPRGDFILSLYNVNYNGHDERERCRDYRISIRPRASGTIDDVGDFAGEPELATGRASMFWGGVWKRFFVHGPCSVTIEVDRQYSLNTILPAVTLDLLDECPQPYFLPRASQEIPAAPNETVGAGLRAAAGTAADCEADAANRLFEALQALRAIAPGEWTAYTRPYYAALLRWYRMVADQPSAALRPRLHRRLAACYYALAMYPEWEVEQQRAGLTTARQIEQELKWNGRTVCGREYSLLMAQFKGSATQTKE